MTLCKKFNVMHNDVRVLSDVTMGEAVLYFVLHGIGCGLMLTPIHRKDPDKGVLVQSRRVGWPVTHPVIGRIDPVSK